MTNRVAEIIEYESESFKADFKKEQYELGRSGKKNELLKDISAFANQLSDEDKYIIVGIKDIDGLNKEIFDIQNIVDDAKYQQYIAENIEPKINFEYRAMSYNNKTIAYFKIFNNKDRPYLFKKDIVNPETGKVDFRYGDGFIRVGTTSKKIGRKELDDIEKNKKKYVDRRNDLTVLTIVNNPEDEDLFDLDLKYIDLKLVNNSNKSIDLDIELKLFKEKDFELISDFNLKRILRQQKKKNKPNSFLSDIDVESIQVPNMHISINENEEELIVSRNAMKGRTAVTLPQNSYEVDIFDQSIIVLQEKPNTIHGIITIRSDEFVEGALIKEINFET